MCGVDHDMRASIRMPDLSMMKESSTLAILYRFWNLA
jgi:hypothetical protein